MSPVKWVRREDLQREIQIHKILFYDTQKSKRFNKEWDDDREERKRADLFLGQFNSRTRTTKEDDETFSLLSSHSMIPVSLSVCITVLRTVSSYIHSHCLLSLCLNKRACCLTHDSLTQWFKNHPLFSSSRCSHHRLDFWVGGEKDTPQGIWQTL